VCVFCEPSFELILHRTEHFLLLLDPFALTPGHLLIASQAHYGCLGEVPREQQEEVGDLRRMAIAHLEAVFNKPVTRYEHGRAGHCLMRNIATRSCHHYHEHLIPGHLALHDSLLAQYKFLSFEQEHEIGALYERYNEYLLVVEPGLDKRFYIARNREVAPHLLRTLSAEALGCPERKNWEDYTSCALMLEGKELLYPLFHNEPVPC